MDPSFLNLPSPITELTHPLLRDKRLRLSIKRDDLIHPHLQGNKWRKLRYNLESARQQEHKRLLTFGGAWSNHIHATAAAGHYFGFETIGIIRGEAGHGLTPTLQDAQAWGMQLNFIARDVYRKKHEAGFIEQLRRDFGDFYLIPEGGCNTAGMQGCEQIIEELPQHYDVVCVDCGTGATMAGIVNAACPASQVLGFAVLKNATFLYQDIQALINRDDIEMNHHWRLVLNYHFGGYAKTTQALIDFIHRFKHEHGIQLEPVYSAKMFYGLFELIEQDYFNAGAHILAVHSGGLQGLRGFKL